MVWSHNIVSISLMSKLRYREEKSLAQGPKVMESGFQTGQFVVRGPALNHPPSPTPPADHLAVVLVLSLLRHWWALFYKGDVWSD